MAATANTAGDYFASIAQSYDSLIRRAVPCYDEMLDRLLAYLPATVGSALELGCGSGNLSLRLAEHWPAASFVVVDASSEMIELTSSRLAAAHPAVASRSRFLVSRFEELTVEPRTLDVATSSISLHHVRDMGPFYSMLRRAVRPGGRFVFADQFRGQPEATYQLNRERWLTHCRDGGNCSDAEIASLVEHTEAHDHDTPLVEHFRLLSAAGFVDVDCVWRNWMWGIITAATP